LISVEIEGLVEVTLKLERTSDMIPRNIQGALEETAQNVVDRAKILAIERLRNPGSYLESFYISAAALEVKFGNIHPAAKIIEEGSVIHVIEPAGRKALKFEKEGTTVFAKRVLHPGTKALWILSDAFTEEFLNLMEMMREATRIE